MTVIGDTHNTSLVHIEGLGRRFGTLWALRDVDLSVAGGQMHVILGHNGAGKTTLFRIILGLIQPTQGKATVAGYDTWAYNQGALARRRIGAVLETNGLYEDLTAWENLELIARIYRLEQRAWRQCAESLLESVNLADRMHDIVTSWSAGMKRKLAVVRALLHKPRVLILDEPMAGLDAVTRHAVRNLLKAAVKKDHVTLLMATQDLAEAEKIATQITILRKGQIRYSGSHADLYDQVYLRKYRVSGHGEDKQETQAIRWGGAVVRREKDHLGYSVVVRYSGCPPAKEVDQRCVGTHEIMEVPVTLEDAYLELAAKWEDADAF